MERGRENGSCPVAESRTKSAENGGVLREQSDAMRRNASFDLIEHPDQKFKTPVSSGVFQYKKCNIIPRPWNYVTFLNY
ncbi:MAG: hypothetical protein A2878_01275 [Candidatus Moranbacteria bacterium RIFCSPHIGHO2_01_FULL_54_31]|nr:MAG: hypothetical protein A2878_01275 [Candidatus Moranbacteria bacterium RIFCSPHIGHO2_01_FULL_54_31]